MKNAKQLLDGIRILDCTVFQQGPCATSILGGLGADVIKIEHPVKGDPGRGSTKILGKTQGRVLGKNFYFETLNINKKSITLDLSQEDGKSILYRLISKSDVFIHNLRISTVKHLGIEYENLRKHNSKLVYAAGSGYGLKGPEADSAVLDPLALARSGFIMGIGDPSKATMGVGIADQISGTLLAFGVILALYARDRLGVSQQVDASLLGSMVWAQSLAMNQALWFGEEVPRAKRTAVNNPILNTYQCKDERWLFLGMFQSDRYWPVFCEAIGRKDLPNDPRFANADSRQSHNSELIQILDQIFITKTQSEWMEHFKKWDFLVAPIQAYLAETADPQLRPNNYVVTGNHPALGAVETIGFPVTLTETPWQINSFAPEFGQHTEEVLLGLGGYKWEEISAFKEKGVIA